MVGKQENDGTGQLDRAPATVSVAMALIDPQGRLVLVQKVTGEWGLPAGGVTPSDFDLWIAAQRELAEETGGMISCIEPRREWQSPDTRTQRHGNGGWSVGFVFWARTDICLPEGGVAVAGNKEIGRVQAFRPEELWALMITDGQIYRPQLNGPTLLKYLRSYDEILVDAETMTPRDEAVILEATGYNALRARFIE